MNTWIEINLPYYKPTDYLSRVYPKFPNLNKRAKKFFKVLPDDLRKKISGEDFDNFKLVKTKIEDDIRNNFSEIDHNSKEFDDLVKEKLESCKVDFIINIISFRKLLDEYNNWYDIQPESVEYAKIKSELNKKYDEEESKLSFSKSKFNVPGVLIEVEKDGKIFQYLIGDINISGGVCDDCMAFDREDIVKRCKIVWKDDNSKLDNL